MQFDPYTFGVSLSAVQEVGIRVLILLWVVWPYRLTCSPLSSPPPPCFGAWGLALTELKWALGGGLSSPWKGPGPHPKEAACPPVFHSKVTAYTLLLLLLCSGAPELPS